MGFKDLGMSAPWAFLIWNIYIYIYIYKRDLVMYENETFHKKFGNDYFGWDRI